MCLLHMAVAYHLAHGWSHAAALEHVEARSGFGPGLYVNFAFAAVWLIDVAWCWASLDAYRNRPRWVSRAVVGFMAFVLFNAAVVYNKTYTAFPSALMMCGPLVLWVLAGRALRPTNGHPPGMGGS